MMKTVKWSVFFINATAFTMMVLVAVFFVQALDSTYSCYQLAGENYCEEIFYDFMQSLGKVSGSYYGILSFALIITYARLNYALKRKLSNDASGGVIRSLNTLFGVLVVSYVLRTVYLFM